MQGFAAPVTGFVASLSDDDRQALERRATKRTFARGDVVFREGERSDHVVVVASGRVKVSSSNADGHEIVLAVRGPGEILGELSTLDHEPRAASVKAADDVDALVLTASDFDRYLEDHPRAALVLLRNVVPRLRDATRQRVEFGVPDVTGRVARRLVELADEAGETTFQITGAQLADWVIASRIDVNRGLQTLAQQGWIESDPQRVVVRDLEALRNRST